MRVSDHWLQHHDTFSWQQTINHLLFVLTKDRGVALEGCRENMTLIAADLGERSLSKVLSEADHWETTHPTVAVAEGLLMYLTDEQVRELRRYLGLYPASS